MQTTTTRLGALFFAAALMLGACGSSSDGAEGDLSSSAEDAESAPETSEPAEETTTTVEETTTTVEDTTTTVEETTTTAAPVEESELTEAELAALEAAGMTEADLALFETLLESEAGRQGMAEGIAEETGLTTEEGLCIVENGDILGLMMIGLAGPDAEPDNELMTSFLQTLDTCGIPLSAFE